MENTIRITKVNSGFIVQDGCFTMAISEEHGDWLKDEVIRWMEDPETVRREYLEKYYNKGCEPSEEQPCQVTPATTGSRR